MRSFIKRAAAVLASAVLLCCLHANATEEISGAGATFPYPVYAKWAEAYKQQTGIGLNYQSIGSGGGIKQIKANTVTFGASDKPLTTDELKDGDLIQWPMIIGGVVPVINVKGIAPGQMVLDGQTLADIYLGEAKYWDDPSIVKINPKLKLPHQPIVQVYRSDGSGTNFLFTYYLTSVNSKFGQKVGANASVQWPAGIGAKGNEGVAGMTMHTDGAIGYVEYAYAVQNKLSFVQMVNKAGKTVRPETATFEAAVANADWAKAPGYYLILTNQPGDKSWPITGASFILMHTKPVDAKASKEALDFFAWAYQNGNDAAKALDYVPLPASVVAQVKDSWKQIDLK
ncbi:MAG: phosphate ABC transporter substrate-binding protein PstS [Alphaproteobacteria bacterium]|nr:phosphate ABC transporter substrate-binding protein PstS [Alphaproteobacteria bacterium]